MDYQTIILFVIFFTLWYYLQIKIYTYDDFLSSEECDALLASAQKKGFAKSKVRIGNQDLNSKSRTSETCFIDTPLLDEKICNLVQLPKNNCEQMQVVKYMPNQFYKPHYDATHNDTKGGLRYCTFLIYLNDDFDGGVTYFPKLNIKVTPKKGKAVLFYNTLPFPFRGSINYWSLHEGQPPKNGIKYICNKWIRIHEYIKK
jgi:prolyl 4-hydroxylase